MLHVHESSTDSFREVRLSRPGVIQVCAHVRNGHTVGLDLTALRIMLVADLIARVAELSGIQAITAHVGDIKDSASHPIGLSPRSLGIHPPAASAAFEDELRAPCDDTADVHVIGPHAAPSISAGIATAVGTTHGNEPGEDDDGALAAMVMSGQGGDPLAVRLALLCVPYFQHADISAETLTRALDRLGGWRRQVARWAESPSRPVPSQLKTRFHEYFDQLATGSVIDLLNDFADEAHAPPGAKFEAFVFADRLLGLDLARSVGQPGS